MKDKVLIVEDELIVARDIRKTLERNGFRVAGVSRTFEKALALIEEFKPSLVLLDIFLKGSLTGIDLAKKCNEKCIPFIYISANSNQQVLEAAKTTNPYGFIVKPFREKDLLITIDIASYRYESEKKMLEEPARHIEIQQVFTMPATTSPFLKYHHSTYKDFIGSSAPMLQLFNLIQQVAPFDTSVLILGESGTGKELAANCIVQLSKRYSKPFIKINCAAIPAELIEAELFGYEKGSFSGAANQKTGKFEQASGGTILLDEIGEIPLEMQGKLLRVLQEKEIQRIGSNSIIKTDVRILAATSRKLEIEVAEGRFRLDLYYRLLVFPITVPPLRDRKEDISPLIDYYIRYYSVKTGKKIIAIDPPAAQLMLQHNWPGNVRELQHVIERSILLTKDDIIREIAFPAPSIESAGNVPEYTHIKTMEEIERDHIMNVLQQCNYRLSGKGGAAELLNIPAGALQTKIRKLGIKITYE